jgi:hypothetical protein
LRQLETTEENMTEKEKKEQPARIDTGGGAYVGGQVSTGGGDFVGRDQITYAQEPGGDEIARLFAEIYQKIEARPKDEDVDKKELTDTVQKIEEEATKGEEANPKKVERWLKTLGMMADDILEVTVACLTSPGAGIAAVIKKIAEKAKGEAGAA